MEIEKLSIDFTMKNARFKVKDNLNNGNVLGKFIINLSIYNTSLCVSQSREFFGPLSYKSIYIYIVCLYICIQLTNYSAIYINFFFINNCIFFFYTQVKP